MKSRYHIWIDTYDKVIDIEAKTLQDMANTQVLRMPTISKPTLPTGSTSCLTIRRTRPSSWSTAWWKTGKSYFPT